MAEELADNVRDELIKWCTGGGKLCAKCPLAAALARCITRCFNTSHLKVSAFRLGAEQTEQEKEDLLVLMVYDSLKKLKMLVHLKAPENDMKLGGHNNPLHNWPHLLNGRLHELLRNEKEKNEA